MSLNKNFLSLDKFIDQALYGPKTGFYMKKNPFGDKGDFITSPLISVLFSEMLSVYEKFSTIYENEIFIVPIDYPYLYQKNNSSNILIGQKY